MANIGAIDSPHPSSIAVKLKFNFKGSLPWCYPFIDLLQGRKDEIILRQATQLQYISDAANKALTLDGCDVEKLEQLKKILDKKVGFSGTKAQIKPSFSEDGECEKVHIVVKWGGEVSSSLRRTAMAIDMCVSRQVHPCGKISIP